MATNIRPPQRCDAFGCDEPVAVMLRVRNIDNNQSEDEFWCWNHENERSAQIVKHSRLIVDEMILFSRSYI